MLFVKATILTLIFETLNRDGFLTLLDSNGDSLDSELERLKADAIYRDLIGQMLTQISAQADQLPCNLPRISIEIWPWVFLPSR